MNGDWSATEMCKPVEWFVLDGHVRHPLGVVRRLKVDKKIVFRAVTWAARSGDRELIGYYSSHEGAATAVHDRSMRERSTSREVDPAAGVPRSRVSD